jgi:hypothetical protein
MGRGRPARLPLLSALLLALPALVLAGCSDASTGPVVAELDARARAWENRGIRDYAFLYQRTCTRCTAEEQELVRIRVRGGQVDGVERVVTGEPIPSSRWDEWPTIPGLFRQLRDHARVRGNQLSVVYDETWDIPVFATALVTGEVGGGFSFTVQDFTPE